MKRFIAIACLFTLLFLPACGVNSQGENPTTAPPQPVEIPAPTAVGPSATPDKAMTQESETDPVETVSNDSVN